MGTFFNSGEENGIKWDIDWNNGWQITVKKEDKTISKTISGHPPICGVDVGDIDAVNRALDELINELQ